MKGSSDKKVTTMVVVTLKVGDRAKILGNIPKPSLDDVQCCFTSCTRC